jgi:hypothetical protein
MTETMTETRLVFLPRPENIYPAWERLTPLFQDAINKAVHGEFTVANLLELSLSGSGLLAYIEDDKEILMALVMEIKHYPDMSVLNVIVMAGQNMKELFSRHSPAIADFARSCGVKYFEASTSRGMAKMLQECGWSHVYETVRFKL